MEVCRCLDWKVANPTFSGYLPLMAMHALMRPGQPRYAAFAGPDKEKMVSRNGATTPRKDGR